MTTIVFESKYCYLNLNMNGQSVVHHYIHFGRICYVMYVFFFHLISIVLSDFMTFHKTFFVSISDLADHFLGNSTHVDYFKLLRKDGSSLLIGARNVIYNLSLPDLKENIEQVR